MTAEQLEAARAERMRQNGHGAITLEDVRTWIEETGLCIFLPRSAQFGFTAPTFVEAVAGERTTEPTLELIATAEDLLVRLEADGVAVRLNLAGQPGEQPDYVVAGWVLPYVYALRGDRDWRRSPQLTGSRQVSQLAVQAAKQIDSANMTAAQIRDALGREVTETAVLRALHELWKQLRIIPVVPQRTHAALWQPLRQRFQKAIAEGASTSQVTAISVLASIYLQAVISASMEEIELFLSPLTSRSKIREVVRGLAATRQVHSTTMGHSPMFYVAGTLPEFPAVPSFEISPSNGYRESYQSYNSSYKSRYSMPEKEGEVIDVPIASSHSRANAAPRDLDLAANIDTDLDVNLDLARGLDNDLDQNLDDDLDSDLDSELDLNSDFEAPVPHLVAPKSAANSASRPAPRPLAPKAPRLSPAASDRRPAQASRGTGSHGSPSRGGGSHSSSSQGSRNGKPAHSNGNGNHAAKTANGAHAANQNGRNGANGTAKPTNGSHAPKPFAPKPFAGKPFASKSNGNGRPSSPSSSNGSHKYAPSNGRTSNGHSPARKSASKPGSNHGMVAKAGSKPAAGPAGRSASPAPRPRTSSDAISRKPAGHGANPTGAKFAGNKFAPKANSHKSASAKPVAGKPHSAKPATRPTTAKPAPKATGAKASAAKRYSLASPAKQAPKPASKSISKPATRPAAKATTKVAARGASGSGAKKAHSTPARTPGRAVEAKRRG